MNPDKSTQEEQLKDPNARVELAKWQYYDAYITDLRQATGYYTGYTPRYLSSLVSADYNHELLRTDDLVQQSLELLAIQIAGSKHRVTVENNPQMEELMNYAMDFLPRFSKHRQEQIANMVLYGMGVQKMHWEKKVIGGVPGVWWVPSCISEIDPRRIAIEGAPGKIKPYFTIWEPEHDAFVKILDRAKYPQYEHCAQNYIWSFYNQDELSAGYGRSMGEILYRLVYMRNELLKIWPRVAEKFGRPLPVVHYDFKGRSGVFNDDTGLEGIVPAAAEIRALCNNIRKQMADDVLVVDADLVQKIEWQEFGAVSVDLIEKQINYIDQRITQVILTNEASTNMGDKGSYAQTNVLVGVANTRIVNYRQGIEEDYRRDLLYSGFVYKNRFELTKWGIPIPTLNEIKLEFYTDSEEMKKEVMGTLTTDSEAKKMVDSV